MTMNTASGIECIGIIMDGNRRWARERNLPLMEGHQEGFKKLKEALRWGYDAGIKNAVIYAFSTENWQRSQEEVDYLMKLLRSILENSTQEMVDNQVRICFIGDRSRFAADFQKLMIHMETATAENYKGTLYVLLSYGGRAEIVVATNQLLAEGVSSVTENSFSEKLWSYPMPDPDLIIRTGGQKRPSNFLSWQSIYSELFFVDTFWPDFSEKEFNSILAEFTKRERRHGK